MTGGSDGIFTPLLKDVEIEKGGMKNSFAYVLLKCSF